jgi:carbon storage regulator
MGMLVLSRKVDEGITITVPPSHLPQQIHVKMIEIRGDKSRIGFDASRDITIHRDEIELRVQQKAGKLGLLRIGDPLPGA